MNLARTRRALIVALIVAIAAPFAGAQTIQSRFNTDLEGWIGSSGGTVTYSPTSGNPGGFLQQADIDSTDMFVIAPAPFLGDRTAYIGGTLAFDAIQVIGTGDYAPFGTVTIRNGGASVAADIAPPGNPTAAWSTFAVTLDAASFGTTPANFASVMGNVTAIEVLLESQVGVLETTGFDNFSISPVPEPTGLAVVGVGGLAFAGVRLRRRRRARPGAGATAA